MTICSLMRRRLMSSDDVAIMTGTWQRGRAYNPFAVQRHGPGNIEYVFQSAEQRNELKQLLAKTGWRVELVGRHGVGKSTLLRTMESWATEGGRSIRRLRCTGDRPRLPLLFWREIPRAGGVISLDGGERCPRWQLRLLSVLTHWRRTGLVITTHQPLGFCHPVMISSSPDQLHDVVAQLLGRPLDKPMMARLDNLLAEHGGSAREVIFQLYDEWERSGD